jgi:hypothetical protein
MFRIIAASCPMGILEVAKTTMPPTRLSAAMTAYTMKKM